MNWRDRYGMIFLLGAAIVAAVYGIRFLTQAIHHFTGSP